MIRYYNVPLDSCGSIFYMDIFLCGISLSFIDLVVYMLPVSLVFHTIVTVELISKIYPGFPLHRPEETDFYGAW